MARPRRTADTRSWVADVVRSGLATTDEVRSQVVEAVSADHPDLDAESTATDWIGAAEADWADAARSWPEVTDFDLLQQVFATLETADVVVLQGCTDHWAARDELARRNPVPRGIAWFTAPDVWHAVEAGMLEVNLWHGTTANAAPGDELLAEVVAAFTGVGLRAHFDEGRIEVAASWHRRPAR